MYVRSTPDAPHRKREGQRKRILLQSGDVEGTDLTATWGEVAPGASHALHRHGPEQVYVVVAGERRLQVGEESREVAAGDLVHVPHDVPRGFTNTEGRTLGYISAATPAFSQTAFYDDGNI